MKNHIRNEILVDCMFWLPVKSTSKYFFISLFRVLLDECVCWFDGCKKTWCVVVVVTLMLKFVGNAWFLENFCAHFFQLFHFSFIFQRNLCRRSFMIPSSLIRIGCCHIWYVVSIYQMCNVRCWCRLHLELQRANATIISVLLDYIYIFICQMWSCTVQTIPQNKNAMVRNKNPTN